MTEAIFGLLGVLIGSGLTIWHERSRHKEDTRKQQEYLAIRVATILDHYIEKCVEVANDSGEPDGNGYYSPRYELPKMDLYSLDVEWRSIPASLMYKILSFPSAIADANNYISYEAEDLDTPYNSPFFAARRLKYAELGIAAIEIASAIRKEYSIPKKEYVDWSPLQNLLEVINKINTVKDEHAKALQEKLTKLKLSDL